MKLWLVFAVLSLVIISPFGAAAARPYLYVFIEFGDADLGLINTETDQIIQVPLKGLDNWPGSTPQHAWAPPDGKTIYVSVDATSKDPAAVVVIKVNSINWNDGDADVAIDKVLILDPPGTPSSFPLVEEVDPRQPVRAWGCSWNPQQPIVGWTQPGFTQGHGPSFLPRSSFMYLTQWTDNRIRVIDSRTNDFAKPDPLSFGQRSRQTHGVNCNPLGTHCLGTGYFYDENAIDLYRANRRTGELRHRRSITLGTKEAYGAFTHYTVWLNNFWALTASMQLGPTSQTPPGARIVGPSIWLMHLLSRQAKQVIGPASGPDDPGIYRSPSDLLMAGSKLYVAEEDSLDGSFGDDGYISVFDISNKRQPRFIKRFKPGKELPADFGIGHGLNVTPDEQFVYVASYASNYIIKIDVITDKVAKVYGGLKGPHGAFIAGQQR